jgi:pullulanase/glycogen debranching enzyme
MKIYSNDPLLRFKTTSINAMRTKAQIDEILAKWGITKTAWEWNPEQNKVVVQFQISEKFHNAEINPVVRLECPLIWKKKGKGWRALEEVDWNVSLRVLHWFIDTMLNLAYATQSEKTIAFLPYIEAHDGMMLKDVILQNLERIQSMPALTEEKAEKVLNEAKQA